MSHFGIDKETGISVILEKIDTKDQKADIFTKRLNTEVYEHIRIFLIGY